MKHLLLILIALWASPVLAQRFVKEVPTVAALQALSPFDVHKSVFVRSYYSEGDGGGGIYIPVNSITLTNFGSKIVSTYNSAWSWNLKMEGNTAYAEQFGAKGDGVTNDKARLQNAIDSLKLIGGKLKLRNKTYLIDGPLIISSPIAGPDYALLSGFTLQGDSIAHQEVDSARLLLSGSNATNTVALIIQRAKGVRIKDITFWGPNVFDPLTAGLDSLLVETNTFMPGIRTNQFSPNAAIAVDVFTSSVLAADFYPGLTTNYFSSGGGSAYLYFEGLTFRYWYNGIALNASPGIANGELVFVDKCTFYYNTFGIGVGQDQSRNVVVRDSEFFAGLCAFSAGNIGNRVGVNPTFDACEFLYMNKIFNVHSDRGRFVVRDCYAEACPSIGVVSGNGGNFSTLISGCEFHLDSAGSATVRRHSEYTVLAQNVPVIFDSCSFELDNSQPLYIYTTLGGAVNSVTFRGCSLYSPVNAPLMPYFNFPGSVRMTGCNGFGGGLFVSDNKSAWNPGGGAQAWSQVSPGVLLWGSAFQVEGTNYIADSEVVELTADTISAATVDAATGLGQFDCLNTEIFAVNDIMFQRGNATWPPTVPILGPELNGDTRLPSGRIYGITNNTIYVDFIPIGTTTASWSPNNSYVNPIVHPPTTGNIQGGGSVNITNVSPIAYWTAGQRVRGANFTYLIITNIVGTTLQVSGTFTTPTTNTALYDALYRKVTTSLP